jgi:hypothetical protein
MRDEGTLKKCPFTVMLSSNRHAAGWNHPAADWAVITTSMQTAQLAVQTRPTGPACGENPVTIAALALRHPRPITPSLSH